MGIKSTSHLLTDNNLWCSKIASNMRSTVLRLDVKIQLLASTKRLINNFIQILIKKPLNYLLSTKSLNYLLAHVSKPFNSGQRQLHIILNTLS